jgi:hypothetical protein
MRCVGRERPSRARPLIPGPLLLGSSPLSFLLGRRGCDGARFLPIIFPAAESCGKGAEFYGGCPSHRRSSIFIPKVKPLAQTLASKASMQHIHIGLREIRNVF